MNDFVLIDLASQLDQVMKTVDGKDHDQILAWLRQHGEVERVPHPFDKSLYRFTSGIGIRTGFRLTNNREIVIIGQHTTYMRNKG